MSELDDLPERRAVHHDVRPVDLAVERLDFLLNVLDVGLLEGSEPASGGGVHRLGVTVLSGGRVHRDDESRRGVRLDEFAVGFDEERPLVQEPVEGDGRASLHNGELIDYDGIAVQQSLFHGAVAGHDDVAVGDERPEEVLGFGRSVDVDGLVATVRLVAEVLEQVVLPRSPGANNSDGDESAGEFLRDEFVERELEAGVDGDGGWDDLTVFVDGESIIARIGMGRSLRHALMVGIVEDVETRGDGSPGVASDVGDVHPAFVVGVPAFG